MSGNGYRAGFLPSACFASGLLISTLFVASSGASPHAPSTATAADNVVFWTRGKIVRLAASGNLVAASTAGIKGACDRIVVWTAPGKKFAAVKTHLHCPNADTGGIAGLGELAVGDGRVAWIEATGGNNLELSLYVAKVSGGPSKMLEFATNGNGAGGNLGGDYVGQLFGAGALLAYNGWRLCDLSDNEGVPTADCPVSGHVSTERLVKVVAGARVTVKSGPASFRLRAAGGGRLALEAATGLELSPTGEHWVGSGIVTVLAAGGAVTATVAAASGNDPPRALALTAAALVIERKTALDLHNPAGGALTKTIPLGTAAPLQLVGANAQLALLLGPKKLVAVRLSDGKQVTYPLPAEATACACPVDAKLTGVGLFYAYNVTATPAKGRIVFEPLAELLARFS